MKLFEKEGADFGRGPYAIKKKITGPVPASKVAQVLKKGGGESNTSLFPLKHFGSIFQTQGRGIFIQHQPLFRTSKGKKKEKKFSLPKGGGGGSGRTHHTPPPPLRTGLTMNIFQGPGYRTPSPPLPLPTTYLTLY